MGLAYEMASGASPAAEPDGLANSNPKRLLAHIRAAATIQDMTYPSPALFDRIVAAGDHYAELLESIEREQMNAALRDRIDAIARRINRAQDENVYGFELSD